MADPTGIAGLATGLPGLLVSCADLYKLLVGARNLDHDVQIVVIKASNELWRFTSWLESVGFVEGVKPKIHLQHSVQGRVENVLWGIKGEIELDRDPRVL